MWFSWLAMMLVHEAGHVLGAVCTGGAVREVVWHPTVISRTDVEPNPHPLVEVSAGPLIGSLIPLALAIAARLISWRMNYLLWGVAGFCLIANGVYIGLGALHPVGDAKKLLALGTPPWLMAILGTATAVGGFWIWHRVSVSFGFGRVRSPISGRQVVMTFVAATLLTALGFVFGNPGM
jgi:hypothetical protein